MPGVSLILVNLAIVARDIAVTLQHLNLGAVQISTVEREAIEWLTTRGDGEPVSIAVIQSSPEAYMQSELRALLEAAGSKVILLVNTAEERARAGMPALALPFFTDDLEALIASLTRN